MSHNAPPPAKLNRHRSPDLIPSNGRWERNEAERIAREAEEAEAAAKGIKIDPKTKKRVPTKTQVCTGWKRRRLEMMDHRLGDGGMSVCKACGGAAV